MPAELSATASVGGSEPPGLWRRFRFAFLAPIVFGVVLGLLEVTGYPLPSLGMLFGFAVTFAGLGAPIGLLVTAVSWRTGCRVIAWSVSLFLGTWIGARVHNAARMSTFAVCAENAKPLIAAIESYRQQHGKPPADLRELVPDHIPRIPSTGLRRYPTWHLGKASDEPYELVVHCSYLLSFDAFVYWPSGRCPARSYGGSPERIGDWVYVHE